MPTVPISAHRAVLLDEAVGALAIDGARANGRYVDATFGRGGHSRAILEKLGPHGALWAFDRDPDARAAAQGISDARFSMVWANFAALASEMRSRRVGPLDGILFDLGVSTPQLEDAARGFSFRLDGPLDMRMDPRHGAPVSEWLASASTEEIRDVIRNYGEERFAMSIAKAIVARRAERPLATTRELATLVARVVRTREAGQDPATRTFQALRIFINQELEELEQGLDQAMDVLAPGGRLAVISFHSLEDRIVKRRIRDWSHPPGPPARLPVKAADLPRPTARVLGRFISSDAERLANPKSRSATLRVAEKLSTNPRP